MTTVAIVGLSNKPDRPSYKVGLYLKNNGFKIIPINPMINEVIGLKSYTSILDIPQDIHIDVVDIFRKPEEVIEIIKEVIESGRRPLIWLQEGVGSPEAKKYAKENGLVVMMDKCIMKEHMKEYEAVVNLKTF